MYVHTYAIDNHQQMEMLTTFMAEDQGIKNRGIARARDNN